MSNQETLASARVQQQQSDQSTFAHAPSAFEAIRQLAGGGSTATRSNSSEDGGKLLQLYVDIQTKLRATNPKAHDFKIRLFEHSECHISAILFYTKDKSNIVYYTVVLPERLGKPIEDGVIPTGGREQVIPRVTIDYFDDIVMKPYVESFLINTFEDKNVSSEQIRHVTTIVIGKNVDLTNHSEQAAVYDNATKAILNSFNMAYGKATSEITAAMLRSQSLSAVASYDIKPGATYITHSLDPLATDFSAVLKVRSANRPQSRLSPHSTNEEVPLAAISGHVDFMYSRETNQDTPYIQRQTGYVATWIINNTSILGKTSNSTDSFLQQLLGLSLIVPLVKDQSALVQLFEPAAINNSDKTSIGALNWEHNPVVGAEWTPGMVNLAGSNEQFSKEKPPLAEFIRYYVSPMPIVAMDIIEGGYNEWASRPLIDASMGNINAENVIIEELDAFFGDKRFSKIWTKMGLDMFTAPPIRLWAGFYPGAVDGRPHDIAEIDYLAVLDNFKGNANEYSSYLAGFIPGDDSDQKMVQRREALRHIHPNATITGTKIRIFPSNGFISAIAQALQASDLQLQTEGDINRISTNTNAHYFNIDSRNRVAVTGAGAFNSGGRNYAVSGFSSTNNRQGTQFYRGQN